MKSNIKPFWTYSGVPSFGTLWETILEIFYVKESNYLIDGEDFGDKTQEPDC